MQIPVVYGMLLLLVIAIHGCATTDNQESYFFDKDSVLRVGFAESAPQLLGKDDKGNLTGLEADLLNLFAKENGLLLDTFLYSREELFFALRRGEIDIAIPGASDTVILANFLAPCAPHFKTGQRVLVDEAISMYITDKSQLDNENVTVLTVVGSVSSNFAKKIFSETKLISLKDMPSCISRVFKGKGNIILSNAPDAWILKSTRQTLVFPGNKSGGKTREVRLKTILPPLTDEQLCWTVRRKDVKLKEFLDAFMLTQKNNGNLEDLIEKNNADAINE